MQILSSLSPLALEHEGGTAVAMGFFDGIHIGHRAVINGAVQWARELAEVLGFKHICTLTVQEHDRMVGYVSQLCHAIAVSLMCANDNTSLCEYTGDSFRDLTRIARINDKMWAELFLWNRDNLISEIDQFDAALGALRNALVAGDREKLEEMFRLSTRRRAAFDKKLPE